MNSLQLLGLVMIIFSFGANIFLPGSVVYYSTTQPTVVFAGVGSTPNNPLQEVCGELCLPTAHVQGISQAEILNASVQVSQWNGNAWTVYLTLPLTYAITLPNTNIAIYQANFQLGSTVGLLYAMSYAIVTTDVGSFTGLAYVQTASLQGYFAINGQISSQNSFIRVSSPTLTLTYSVNTTITGAVQQGTISAYVNVLDSKGNLIQKVPLTASTDFTNQNLTATYMLQNQGAYTLNGFVTYGGQTTQQMSIIGVLGSGSTSFSQMSLSDYYWIVGLIGVVFIILGARKKKKESR